MEALENVCREGPRTRDVGGTATTAEVGDAVVAALSGRAHDDRPGDDEHPGEHGSPADHLGLPKTNAARSTPQSDCVALSGATTVTRPRSSATITAAYARPSATPAGAERRRGDPELPAQASRRATST